MRRISYRFLVLLLSLSGFVKAYAQAIYDTNGQYKGYSQTSPSGVTTTYNAQGQSIGSSQVDSGQTNYYSPSGVYQGSKTTPAYTPQNSTINTPRQVPQAPSARGW